MLPVCLDRRHPRTLVVMPAQRLYLKTGVDPSHAVSVLRSLVTEAGNVTGRATPLNPAESLQTAYMLWVEEAEMQRPKGGRALGACASAFSGLFKPPSTSTPSATRSLGGPKPAPIRRRALSVWSRTWS
jgi:hypothetical protein